MKNTTKTTTLVIETLTHTRIANLNRDDLGEVKRAGDRIRISSQCLKRNVRLLLNEMLGSQQNAVRSRQIPQDLIKKAVANGVCDAVKAGKAAEKFFGKTMDPKKVELKTLVFLSAAEIGSLYDGFVEVCLDGPNASKGHLDVLKGAASRYGFVVSLFGRMFADSVDLNVEGAAAFKHAYTVQAQDAEKDFFTAVDDFQEQGSGHLGISEFASGDFYNCVHLNLGLLASNLGLESDSEEFKGLVEAFLKAVISSFPKAKHNSNLANNLPYYVRTRIVTGFACTNDDAFAEPLATMDQQAIVDRFKESVAKKDAMYDGLSYNVLGTWEAFNSSVKELVEETVKYVG
jgi:CRISPR system Cascade subunit CasC